MRPGASMNGATSSTSGAGIRAGPTSCTRTARCTFWLTARTPFCRPWEHGREMRHLIYRDAQGRMLRRGLGLLLAMILSLPGGCGGPKDEPYHGTVSLKRFPQKKTIDTNPAARK